MMIASLLDAGHEIVDTTEGADAVIINTCGFIDDAVREAIENVLDMVELKNEGVIRKIIVTGCMVEKFRKEIFKEIPEVDAVVGLGALGNIVSIVDEVFERDSVYYCPPSCEMPLDGQRSLTTPEYWAYLRIADGCSNRCSYCLIPSIRGDYRSRKLENIIDEAKQLAETGVKELVLIAQDTTYYGKDLYGEYRLPELLNSLCEIDGIEWIRLLYCYPDKMTDELIDVIAAQEKVLHYIDLPVQHGDDKILKAMNRHGNSDDIRALVNKLRERIPDIVIRTTVMVGFPGEGEEEFENLAVLINELEFDRLGCFEFSPQENTPAATMEGAVDDETKSRRAEIIMNDQFAIMQEKNLSRVGSVCRVLTESYDGYSDSYTGRSYADAPEIDGVIYFTSEKDLEPGDFVDVLIEEVRDYDLLGRAVS